MHKKLLYTILLLAAGNTVAFSQTFSPLGGYNFPTKKEAGSAVSFRATDCGTFEVEDLIRILPGETAVEAIRLDTIGLDGEFIYSCSGCTEVDFGTVVFANDTLFFAADAGAEEELVELTFEVCTAAGDCSPPITRTVLVQRAGVTVDLGNQAVAPSGTIDANIPLGNLPSPTFCRTVESCADDYPGREQRAFFQFGIGQSNEVRYVAARAAGTDVVCVTLCTELGLCDTYTTSFTVTRPTVNLPFFDDFSYEGFRPDADLWQDEDVLINRSFAIAPPSIGVATFDAVNFDGLPYEQGTGGSGSELRDFLTSAPINLQGRSGTTLNFYLQPRGLGNRPERLDSFLVQFLTPAGRWETVLGIEGVLNTVGTTTELPFAPYTVPLDNQYLYNGFQFRFANKSDDEGAVDMWHLDYVKLDNESTTIVTQDLALTTLPDNLLATYTSMPLRHYQAVGSSLLTDSITLELFNSRGDVTPISRGRIVITDEAGTPITSGSLIISDLFQGIAAVDSLARDFRRANFVNWPNLPNLINYLAGLDANASVKIFNRYLLDVNTEVLSFSPAIQENSNVSNPTCFDEYFAYDDASAELTLEIDPGNTILQSYDTYVNDQLLGVRVAIPRGLGPLGDQDLRLVVYTGDTMPETLIYEEDFPVLQPEDFFFDSLQGYTTYLFAGPLNISAGRLFVGWEQQSANRNIGVGFDRNNAPEDVQWFNVGNGWRRLRGTTTGAIMLRPLLSGFEGFQTDTEDPATDLTRVEIFPNPTSGTLHLRPRPDVQTGNLNYRLFSFSGAILRAGPVFDRLDIGDLPAGIYLLELSDGQHRERHKIVRN